LDCDAEISVEEHSLRDSDYRGRGSSDHADAGCDDHADFHGADDRAVFVGIAVSAMVVRKKERQLAAAAEAR